MMAKTNFRFHSDSDNSYHMYRHFEELSVDSFKHLIKDEKTEQRIALILSQYESEKYTIGRVPTTITEEQMKDLLSLRHSRQRRRWFDYLFQREITNNNESAERKKRCQQNAIIRRKRYEIMNCPPTGLWNNEGQLQYGLWHNSLFTRISRTSVNRFCSHRLQTAALFGTKLVIDLDFDQYMKLQDCRRLAQQIKALYAWNLKATQPFDLHFSNCDANNRTLQAIQKYLPQSQNPGLFWRIFSRSHL